MEDFSKSKRRKKLLIGIPAGVVILALIVAIGYFFVKADLASQPTAEIISSQNSQDNGNGIALPGLEGSDQSALGAPDQASVAAALGGQPSSSSQSQPAQSSSGGQGQQNKPVRSQTLSNGLRIDEYSSGQGERSTKVGDTIAAHYIGYLPDGQVFDTSLKGEKKPLGFKLGAGQVIAGWDIGLQDMKVGAVRRLTIPAALAYGSNGHPPAIPPNATLVFDVQLMGIQ